MCARAHSAGDELVVDVEVSHLVALPVGVDLLEHRLEVQVQPAIAALVHDPRHGRRARRMVRHLYARSMGACVASNLVPVGIITN